MASGNADGEPTSMSSLQFSYTIVLCQEFEYFYSKENPDSEMIPLLLKNVLLDEKNATRKLMIP